jgi:two-component system, cell cycle sensor histidine kinase and response regulator CckA
VSDQAPHHLSQALQRDLAERCYTWLESIAEGCVVLDPMLVVRYCNPAFAAIWGRQLEELLGEPLTEVPPRFGGSTFLQLCDRALLHGRLHEGDAPVGERWFRVRVHPLADGVLALMADVTDERRQRAEHGRLQERLHLEQKRESLDVLVGGVAHDFNNLLVGILNGSELLLRELPEGSPLRATADMVCKAGLRARDVARQMLVFVGKGRSVRQPFDFNLLVRENLPLLKSAFPERVHVEAVLHEGLPLILADAGQMQQVVMNLLINAAEALPPAGGTVRVTTGLVPPGDPLTPAPLPPGEKGRGEGEGASADGRATVPYVFLEVSDNGSGMTAEVQARIFQPFFTTKPGGHGLGLAAVRKIVRAHEGVIHLSSTPGDGTTIRACLPGIVPPPPAAAPAAADTASTPGEVLIVDDEPFVRDVVSRMLRKAGLAAREAGSGPDALALVRDNPAIGVVVLDLRMPGMDGWETFRLLGAIRPDVRAILTSGCAGDDPPVSDDPRLIGFLPKPYVFEDLLRLVQQGLARAE